MFLPGGGDFDNFFDRCKTSVLYQVGFSAFGGDSCVKRDGGTSLESGVRPLLMYTLLCKCYCSWACR